MIKLLGENVGINLHDIGLGNGLLDMMPKANVTKGNIGTLDSIQIRHVVSERTRSRKRRDDAGDGRHTCKSCAKGLVFRTLRT